MLCRSMRRRTPSPKSSSTSTPRALGPLSRPTWATSTCRALSAQDPAPALCGQYLHFWAALLGCTFGLPSSGIDTLQPCSAGCTIKEAKAESFTPGFRISPEGKFLESYSLDDDAHAIAADWAEVQRAWNISRPSWHGKCPICTAQEISHETCSADYTGPCRLQEHQPPICLNGLCFQLRQRRSWHDL